MATLSITIPNTGAVPTLLLELAARDGFQPASGSAADRATALQDWLRHRIRQLYREQARARTHEQAISDAEVTIDTAAATIT